MTLNELLTNIGDNISAGIDTYVEAQVSTAVAPPTAQQVPTAVNLPTSAEMQRYTPYLLAGAALLAFVLLKR